MKFTGFTLLYLAIAACFTIIAFQKDSVSISTSSLLTACLAYFQATLSLFPWQRQRQLQLQAKLSHYRQWQQIVINTWVAAVLLVILMINLITHNISLQLIPAIGVLLIVITIILESFWVRRQLS